jgi:hypothetical protein
MESETRKMESSVKDDIGATGKPAEPPTQSQPDEELANGNVDAAKIPPILFEGDEPSLPAGTGPGEKYVLGPTPHPGEPGSRGGRLPAFYGTGELLLVARDPHWLYAHWDLSEQQQRRYNALSVDHHLVVRVKPGTISGHASSEIHVHPESRHWFMHVDRAATEYTAELGYHPTNTEWVTVATSMPARTPPDTASAERTVRFATIPLGLRLRQSASRAAGPRAPVPSLLAAARERALGELITRYFERHDLTSSAEIPELIRGQRGEKRPTLEGMVPTSLHEVPLEVKMPGPAGVRLVTISSPTGGEAPAAKGFWFKVNAELVIYGATEPDARVMLGRWPVQLRPDGTFRLRFALPDGGYELSLSAISVEGESRSAVLRLSRSSEYQGEVGAHTQDEALLVPGENL